MPKVKANGVELYYELHGPEQADVLVLSNGILMSTASWGLQVPILSKYYRVLLYDCRGMWKSDHPKGPYTMELHADDLAVLLDELKIAQAHICGISYGAELSMEFAVKYPQRTRSLILASSVSESDEVLSGLIESWRSAARAGDPQRLFEVSYALNFSSTYITKNQAAIQAAGARYSQLDMNAVLELIDCFQRFNFTEQLAKIATRTLVMVGENDILKPRKYSELIVEKIPGAELVVVPDSGHALCLEKPLLFNALVLGFLAVCQ